MLCRKVHNHFRNPIVDFEYDRPEKKFMPSLTDPSYYVPDSEHLKNLANIKGSSIGAYDNQQVTRDLVDLRRPGLDRVEASYLVECIKQDTRDKVDMVLSDAMQKDFQSKADFDNKVKNAVSSHSVTPSVSE